MSIELSRTQVEELLAGFLTGSLGLTLGARITDVRGLPQAYRSRVQGADSNGRVRAAWQTNLGPVIVWGEYDLAASNRLAAHVLFIEWTEKWLGQHGLWCYCYPGRPTEWVVGRGDGR